MHSPTVRRIVGPTILLASGNYFDLLAPETSTFTIEDIAHGLSNVCRFAGQCSRFFSVAQHSVLVSQIVPPEDAYAALMHDAAEALIGDVSKPLKGMLPDYRKIESAVEAAVFERFGVPPVMPASVKQADLIMLATEQHHLMPDREGRSYAGGHTPLDIDIPAMGPAEAKALFLARFAELAPSCVARPLYAAPAPYRPADREEIAEAAFVQHFLHNATGPEDDWDAATIAWSKERYPDDRRLAYAIADSILALRDAPRDGGGGPKKEDHR